MSDHHQSVPFERRRGLLALTPYATAIGVIAIIYLFVIRGRQTEDGPLDLLTALIALAVGLTVFCGLWWMVTSRGAQDFADWWKEDDPTAHVHVPIWGTALVVLATCLFFYSRLEESIGAFGVVLALCVLQIIVLNIVGRHLARRLERGLSEAEVASTIKWSMVVTGVPFILLAIVVWIMEIAVLTDSVGGDIAVSIFLLAPGMIVLLYIGFAIVYGGAEAVEQTWHALFGRGEGSS